MDTDMQVRRKAEVWAYVLPAQAACNMCMRRA